MAVSKRGPHMRRVSPNRDNETTPPQEEHSIVVDIRAAFTGVPKRVELRRLGGKHFNLSHFLVSERGPAYVGRGGNGMKTQLIFWAKKRAAGSQRRKAVGPAGRRADVSGICSRIPKPVRIPPRPNHQRLNGSQ
ncbi:hypothetical protein AVEN_96400-1 [Araneus ventricosus]|uniref:Uncharacterized protein n=1 Tax=Araneus ventricosus TaxID=182803 RepID=A0A4Y2J428_ARAVE|nr:hypothetical protein AVEN_96400-1 [Araneus ventricosus]